jgi:flagellin
MALRIVNNVSALNAQRNLANTQNALSKSMERLSSGLRINRAADDAAGLSISQQFRADLAAYGAASNNTVQASSMLKVAEGGLDSIHGMLTRLKELAVQAASDNTINKQALDDEAQEIISEVTRVAESTKYNSISLIDGTYVGAGSQLTIQVGSENNTDQRIQFNIGAATASAIGVTGGNNLTDVDLVSSLGSAQTSIDIINVAISDISNVRAEIGANMNRLSYTSSNLAITMENVSASESVIRDTDMAAEMTDFTRNQILRQAGTAMLAQANSMPQAALSLLG